MEQSLSSQRTVKTLRNLQKIISHSYNLIPLQQRATCITNYQRGVVDQMAHGGHYDEETRRLNMSLGATSDFGDPLGVSMTHMGLQIKVFCIWNPCF